MRVNPAALRALLRGPNGPVAKDLQRRVLRVHGRAARLCPVDTGRLRSSIRWTIGQDNRGLVGIVGTDVHYAPYVHNGTRPHFPPPGAMQPWARRHGFPPGAAGAFLVARAISRRGTKPRPFLARALEEARHAT